MEQTKAIEELRELHTNPYSIDVVEWWLMKYADLRKISEIDRTCICGASHDTCICFKEPCECFYEIPCFCGLHSDKNNAFRIFRDIFDKLDELTHAHSYEKYFENELIEYETIKDNQDKLIEWVKKNESLGDKYFMFGVHYLDYVGEVPNLKLQTSPDENLEISLNIKDFKHINNFLNIFNDLFWVKEILPENLQKRKEKTNEFLSEHSE